MIRKLKLSDHEKAYQFLSEEPSINLFIIGDIEAFGYESEFQELWGDFNDKGELNAVLLRFYQSFIPYAKGDFDIEGFASIMKESGLEKYYLSGKTEIVERFEEIEGIVLGPKQSTFFAECPLGTSFNENNFTVKKADFSDVDRIIEIRSTIEEFHITKDARDMLTRAMESKTGRTYFTEEHGIITACVSSTAENSLSAMIVGVCTRSEYRGKGLATSIMEKLFHDVMGEGKTLCLFYDNPAAGRIYKRLGFQDIGRWTMYR